MHMYADSINIALDYERNNKMCVGECYMVWKKKKT